MSLDTSRLDGPYRCVFDVGAYQGEFAAACLTAWPECQVECFEPLGDEPELAAGVRWHRVALGPEAADATRMFECETSCSSSMLPMAALHKTAFPYTRRNTETAVPMRTLDSYAHLLWRPALLKIDVQGYELEVLRGAGLALDWFNAVALEVSWEALYDGAPTFADLDGFLVERAFVHAWRLDELRHPRTDVLLQSDELWLR